MSEVESTQPSGKKSVDIARDEEMRMRLELLSEDFSKFRSEFGMPLHIKDFCGYILAHPVLGEFAGSYLYHENSFCNYVKSNHDTNEKCIITSNELMMQHLRRRLAKLRRTTPPRHRGLRYGYYGVCWCGIGEYVYPICHNGVVIGALLAGSFRSDERRLSHSFARLEARWGFDQDSLRGRYDESTGLLPERRQQFELRVSMLAEFMSMLAEYYIEYPLIAAFNTATERTNRHRIVNLAIDYITKNLSHKISVADMAVYCMCSKSTLNHLFSAVMGRTIPEFVSIQRVNRAKYMIMNTSLGIEQIGTQCGFMSAAYFSVVFKKLSGQTPTEFREHMRGRSREDVSGIL